MSQSSGIQLSLDADKVDSLSLRITSWDQGTLWAHPDGVTHCVPNVFPDNTSHLIFCVIIQTTVVILKHLGLDSLLRGGGRQVQCCFEIGFLGVPG